MKSPAVKIPVSVVECRTCNDYQLTPAADGMLERCPDCLVPPTVRCPAHGKAVVDGKCPACGREADIAEEIVSRGSRALHPLGGTVDL